MKPYNLYQLLEQLIATPYCTASSLAKQLVPFEKTVRTDLKHTEPLLSDFALSLMRKPGCGIILSGSRKNMMRLQSYLQEEKAHCSLVASMKRVSYILYSLLRFSHTLRM